MKLYVGLITTLLTISFSCSTQPAQLNTLNGIWQSLGSGWLLDIKDSTTYSIYDITSISCLPNHAGALNELQVALNLEHDTLSLEEGLITYQFTRAKNLPELCTQQMNGNKKNSALYNFEVFSETVKEHYAFMALNDINWNELYNDQKRKLNKQSTPAELYLVIEDTLEKLNDNHAFLEAPAEVYDSIDSMMNSHEADTHATDNTLPEYGDFPVADMVAKHHLVEDMTEDSWLIKWGKFNHDIGYIQIKAMWLYADLDIPQQLIDDLGYVDAYIDIFNKMYEGDYIQKEVQSIREIMDKVMNDLSTMASIVIDVRFNGGGQDAVSFEILNQFSTQKKQVAKQKFRDGKTFTTELALFLEGTKHAFTKPVYILTSPQTGSAAEAFSLASLSMQHVKRIGSSTLGALSTTLDKTLPIGWTFSISNEIYMDNKGTFYENKGVPVDFELNYPRDRQDFFRSVVNDLDFDKKTILNAIDKLENK